MYGYGNYGYTPSYAQQTVSCQVITRVNGRNGADAYRLAPNSSILLLDENDQIVRLKTTDGAGYPTVTPYTITPYQPKPAVDMNSLENRVKKLEDIVNGKSDKVTEVKDTATAIAAIITGIGRPCSELADERNKKTQGQDRRYRKQVN